MSEPGADMARQSGRVKEVEHRGDEITLQNVIDRCEDVANVIEGVALEYS